MRRVKKHLIWFLCLIMFCSSVKIVNAEEQETISEVVESQSVFDEEGAKDGDTASQFDDSDISFSESDAVDSEEKTNSENKLDENQTEEDMKENLEEDEKEKTEGEGEDIPEEVPEEEKMELSYQVHVQNVGWQEWKNAGELAGTVGSSLRLEALRIKVDNDLYEGDVEYRVHVQNIGWQAWKKNGELAGTEGKSLRIEAIQIRLTGELAEKYNLTYETHVADFGWLPKVNAGELAGTEGFAKRLECIRVSVEPIEQMDTSSTRGFIKKYGNDALTYWGHVQNKGDTSSVKNGETLGTTGKSLRIEGLAVQLNTAPDTLKGGIEYRVHVQDIGWMDWKKEGEYAGTRGQGKRVEAIQIRLTGEAAKYYNIYYRCHVQNFGWMGWAVNGQSAGSAKYAYRMEALQIKLVLKTSGAPGSTKNCYAEAKTGWYYEGGYKFYYNKGKKVTDVRGIIGKQSSYEIRVNKQKSCVTVYAKDGNKGYIIPVVAFACSPGAGTPIGTFYTPAKYRWQALYGAQGQWCTRITGHILFHSPPYTKFDNHTLWPAEYNKLGTWASQGCIRLRSGDAKWIYDNCPLKTKVIIYNSSNPGPLGKPVYAKIPLSQHWDPTDPTV